MQKLDWTGERYIPEVAGDVELEHLHRYKVAQTYVQNKIVLDLACGEGYGSNLLAMSANQVIGVDIDQNAVSHAQKKYQKANLSYLHGDCSRVPLADNSVDIVVSFETIEHHDQHLEMMGEIKRVMKADGLCIISSPDKLEYSEKRGYENKFHVKELYKEEFFTLLQSYFKYVQLSAQRLTYGSSIIPEEGEASFLTFRKESNFENTNQSMSLPNPHYNIAFASDLGVTTLIGSIFEVKLEESEQAIRLEAALRDTNLHNTDLIRQLNLRSESAETLLDDLVDTQEKYHKLREELEDRTKWAMSLDESLSNVSQDFERLNKEYEDRTKWAMSLDESLSNVSQDFERLNKEYEDRTKWAMSLDESLSNVRQDFERLNKEYEAQKLTLQQSHVQLEELENRDKAFIEVIIERDRQLSLAHHAITSIEASTIWRYSSPLRKLVAKFRK
jgi:ubiquinone/menaquinone biosynthesis C-methylase UbiE/predicted  nucleic acid-binding Zn-ribbon protein